MGLELILLPVDFENAKSAESYTIFHCDKDRYLFDQIEGIPERHFSVTFKGLIEDEENFRYCSIEKDAYQEELTYALVKYLLKCTPHPEALKNQAIWAYLSKLSPSTKVALYWN